MDDGTWKFIGDGEKSESLRNLADDPRISLLACCVANQQRNAGFGLVIDIREAECPCGSPGFNTGMGTWMFTCGAEYHADGTVAEPCPKSEAA